MHSWLKKTALTVVSVLIAGCSTVDKPGTYKGYETPSYQIMRQDGAPEDQIEIRHYAPMLVAEITVTGDRKEAANNGFRQLAGYIFGDNVGIDMTSPVTQSPAPTSTKIAMTSPVVQTGDNNEWVVQFTMPKKYTLETLPKAENKNIRFRMTAPYDSVSIRFNGFWSAGNMAEHQKKLDDWIAANKIAVTGPHWYAFYDSPFTLPWNRRNEIHYRIASPDHK